MIIDRRIDKGNSCCKCFYYLHIRSMLMTACDLGAVTRPWEISKQVKQKDITIFFYFTQ